MNLFADVDMERSATFSPCRLYRYTLVRVWDHNLPRLLWILLNPSTADAEKDDPTNRKGIKFSQRWSFGSCVFVNLFAFRSPHPRVMKAAPDPVGVMNDSVILEQARLADRIVVAWGNDGAHRGRASEVLKLLGDSPTLWCLKLNKTGEPFHPLYARDAMGLVRFVDRNLAIDKAPSGPMQDS